MPMTPEERAQSLANARLACEWIFGLVEEYGDDDAQEQTLCLIAEFARLDAKEQAQAEAGKLGGPHGGKGGRPRKTKKGGKK